MTAKPGRQPSISAQEWEAIKPILYKIYIQQDLTLRASQRVMSERYGFVTSIQCYKRKFAEWNWHKYNSITKTRAVSQPMQGLGRDGEPASCNIDGSVCHREDFESTLKRSREYKSRRAVPKPTRSFIVSTKCRTQPPSDNPVCLSIDIPDFTEIVTFLEVPATTEMSAMDCDWGSAERSDDQQVVHHAGWSFQDLYDNVDYLATQPASEEVDTTRGLLDAVQSDQWLTTMTTSNGHSPARQQHSNTYNHNHLHCCKKFDQIEPSLKTPDVHFYSEKMLWTMRTFLIQKFESKQWYSVDPRYDCRSQGFDRFSKEYSNRTTTALQNSYDSTNFIHAIAYMNRACSLLMSDLCKDDPLFMQDLFWAMRRYRHHAFWDLNGIFLRHLQGCAQRLHQTNQHPLVIWAGLMHNHGFDKDVLDTHLYVLQDVFNQELSSYHYSSLAIYCDVLAETASPNVIASWRSLYSDIKTYIGRESALHRHCRAKLARLLYQAGAYKDVLNLFPHPISTHTTTTAATSSSNGEDILTARLVSASLFALSRRTEAIFVLRKGLKQAKTSKLTTTTKMAYVKDFLDILSDSGEVEEAHDFIGWLNELEQDEIKELEEEMEKMRLGIIE